MKYRKLSKHLHFGTAYILLVIIGFSWHMGSFYFEKQSHYQEYVKSLEKASLINTPMAKAWIDAGKASFSDSVYIKLPYSESVHFSAQKPQSKAYKFNCSAHQVLTVNACNNSKGKVFTELFIWKNKQWQPLAETDTLQNLVFTFKKDAKCLLRIQPELLIETDYSINLNKRNEINESQPFIDHATYTGI